MQSNAGFEKLEVLSAADAPADPEPPGNCFNGSGEMTDRSNADWVRALSGQAEESAVEELRRRLVAGLRRAFQGNPTVDDGFVEDTAQVTLMRILRNIEGFRGDSRFLTWSMTIASRVAWTELRRKRWKDVSLESVLATGERLDHAKHEPEFEASPDRTMLRGLLEELIRTRLTDRQRQAILAELAGMPQEEVARRMGSNRNAIYKLVYDARRNLKRGLEEAGYGAEQALATFAR